MASKTPVDRSEPREPGSRPPRNEAAPLGPDVVALALKHKWLLTAGLVAGLVVGQLVYMKLGPTFQATARVLVSKRVVIALKDETGHTGTGERGEHVALIMSPMIVGEAVKKYDLAKLASLRAVADPVQKVLGTLKVRRTSGSDRSVLNILDISFESPVRQDAVVVVKAVVSAYRDYLARSQQEYSAETLSLISQANDDLLKNLRAKEAEYVAFRSHAPLHWRNAPGTDGQPGDMTNVHQERVLAIEAQRRVNLLKRTETNSRLQALIGAQQRGESREALEVLAQRFLQMTAQAANTTIDPNSGAARQNLLGNLESRLLPLILEEKRLLRSYGADHPDVKAARKSIETTRQFYRDQGMTLPGEERAPTPAGSKDQPPAGAARLDLVGLCIDALHQESIALEIEDAELTRLFDQELKQAKAFTSYQLEDQTRNEEVKRLKTLWDLVVNRLNMLKLPENGGFSLKELASPKEDLVIQRQVKIVGAGAGVGLLLALAVVYLRALLDTTVRTADEVQRTLGLPLVGRVPQIDHERLPALAAGAKLDPSLYYFHNPGSPEAEAFRSVRSALYVAVHSRGHKVLQVTSPEPQDGKTTLTSNLAIAMAQSGKKVLLIDADLRCPKVHKLFALTQEPGLADVLQGEIDWQTALRETEVPGLSILPAGHTPDNPAEMLSMGGLERLLQHVRGDFDFILVDTPPLLAVSDPCSVAAVVDTLLLVVRVGKNRRPAIKRAHELLETHGIQTLGVVVNGASRATEAQEGYYRSYTNSSYFPAQGSNRTSANLPTTAKA